MRFIKEGNKFKLSYRGERSQDKYLRCCTPIIQLKLLLVSDINNFVLTSVRFLIKRRKNQILYKLEYSF